MDSLGKQNKIISNTHLINERQCLPTLSASFQSSFLPTVSKNRGKCLIKEQFSVSKSSVFTIRTVAQVGSDQLEGRCLSVAFHLYASLFITDGLPLDESRLWELDLSA